jgi:hypothetical protein
LHLDERKFAPWLQRGHRRPAVRGNPPPIAPHHPVKTLPLFTPLTQFTALLVNLFTEKSHVQKELSIILQSRYHELRNGGALPDWQAVRVGHQT